MVLFSDPICSIHNEEHLVFNKGLISVLRVDGARYGWSGDKRYGEELFSGKGFSSYSLVYNNQYSFKEAFRRYLFIFKVIKRNKSLDTVFFLSFDNSLFPAFCLLFSPFLNRRKFVCVVHNNIKTLKDSFLKRCLFRILNYCIQIEYIVLTKSMKFYADEILQTPTRLLYHPFYQSSPKKTSSLGVKSFLTVGRQAIDFYNNGFYNIFLTICNHHIKKRWDSIKLTIGLPSDTTFNDGSHELLQIQLITGFISRTDYLNHFDQTLFVIFPDTEDSEYRASGTLMDTLSAGAIFIAPRKGHFAEFEGCGILYEKGEFGNALMKSLSCTEDEIIQMRSNMLQKRLIYEAENKDILKHLLV